jgi:hypothetical protein
MSKGLNPYNQEPRIKLVDKLNDFIGPTKNKKTGGRRIMFPK